MFWWSETEKKTVYCKLEILKTSVVSLGSVWRFVFFTHLPLGSLSSVSDAGTFYKTLFLFVQLIMFAPLLHKVQMFFIMSPSFCFSFSLIKYKSLQNVSLSSFHSLASRIYELYRKKSICRIGYARKMLNHTVVMRECECLHEPIEGYAGIANLVSRTLPESRVMFKLEPLTKTLWIFTLCLYWHLSDAHCASSAANLICRRRSQLFQHFHILRTKEHCRQVLDGTFV